MPWVVKGKKHGLVDGSVGNSAWLDKHEGLSSSLLKSHKMPSMVVGGWNPRTAGRGKGDRITVGTGWSAA